MNAPGEVKPEAEREEASEDQIEEEAEDPVTVYENYKCVQSFILFFSIFLERQIQIVQAQVRARGCSASPGRRGARSSILYTENETVVRPRHVIF